jgi:transcription elongation GreA/GreB family factor
MTFKTSILTACKQVIHYKITLLNDAIAELGESNDSKSSAGDKHETTQAMVHLEQEKLSKQLLEWNNQNDLIQKIDGSKEHSEIGLGSLIETNNGKFFLACNLGKLTIDDADIIVISLQSPLGEKFLGRKEGDLFDFNNTKYQILKLS